MKKNYFSWGFLAALFLWGTGTVAAQEIEYALNESFEQGLPDGWTQEHVSGSVNWIAETGGDYPAGAADGQGRMALRNTTGQTQGFVTRLVTPVMDLSQMYQPILIFSHAQEHNLGDVDELRVYYRTSADGDWILYEEDGVFTERIRKWQADTIILNSVTPQTTYYQIAFEGTDRFGAGIVLDQVQVRPMPTCSDPTNLTINMGTSNSFQVNWQTSFDSESSVVRVSTSPLDDPETATPEELLLDTVVSARQLLLENLEINMVYYVYIKANCLGETSGWSHTSYRTNALVDIPYLEKFNIETEEDVSYVQEPETWTWGNSWGGSASPQVNVGTNSGSLYFYSPDSTTAVCFTGSSSTTTPVPAGEMAWLISPELNVEDIHDVQVSFWAGCWVYYKDIRPANGEYASALIVGVMEDPSRIETFVPIDTIQPSNFKLSDKFIVRFDQYEGEGKYVVFVSAFDKQNLMYLDNVSFDYLPVSPEIDEINVNPGITSAQVTIDPLGAASWELAITTVETSDPSTAEKVHSKSGIVGNTYEATGLTASARYYAYVRTANSQGEYGPWSLAKSFVTYGEIQLPLELGFEEDEPTIDQELYYKYWEEKTPVSMRPYIYHTTPDPPYVKSNSSDDARTGEGSLFMHTFEDCDAWFTFTPMDNVKDLQLSFWLRNYSTSYEGVLAVGVMTDPEDLSTFDTIAVFKPQQSPVLYEKCQVYFDEYKGDGKFIAMWAPGVSTYVDDLVLSVASDCPPVANLQAEPLSGGHSVRLDWESEGADKFRVLIDDFDMTDTLDMVGLYDALVDTVVENVSSVTIAGLTDAMDYFVTVRSECDGSTGNWLPAISFTTTCVPLSLPYEMDFDDYASTEVGSRNPFLPPCWDTEFASYKSGSANAYMPYIYNSSIISYSAPNCLYFQSKDSTSTYPWARDYVLLPEMEAPVTELQVSFMLKQGNLNYKVLVGVLPNGADTTAFIPVDTLQANSVNRNVWREVIVPFTGRTDLPEDGRIMIRSFEYTSTTQYIDDIVVDYAQSCFKPDNLKAKDVSDNSATLYWDKGGDETMWDVMVLNKIENDDNDDVTPDNATADDIVYHAVHTGEPEMTLTDADGLEINTPYWYYLRSICAEGDTTGWNMFPGEFRTSCVPALAAEMGVERFEDDDNNLSCWVLGAEEGTEIPETDDADFDGYDGNSLRIYAATSSSNVYAIMPEVEVDSISRLEVHFSASGGSAANSENWVIVGVVSSTSDLSSFMSMDTINLLPSQFQHYVVRFEDYKGDGYGHYGKRVMFLVSKLEDSNTNNAYIDNVQLDTIPAHRMPIDVYADNITDTGATIHWDNTGATSYRVIVSLDPMGEDGTLPEVLAFDQEVSDVTSVQVDGLNYVENYYMYVQAIYEDGNRSEWSYARRFTTACPTSFDIPYLEDFGGYETGSNNMAPCWTSYYTTNGTSENTAYPYVNDLYNNTAGGENCLYFYAAGSSNSTKSYSMGITPILDTDDISRLRLSFDMMQYTALTTSMSMIVGVTQYPDSLTLDSFVPLDTINVADQPDAVAQRWYSYQYDLTGLDTLPGLANYKHVVFAMYRPLNSRSGGLYIDNLSVAPIPTCEAPANMKASDYKESSFTVTWSNPGVADTWNVEYGPIGFTQGEGTTLQVKDTVVEITGLTENSQYDVYVQAVCGVDDNSAWEMVQGRTIGLPVTIFPYTCGFEDEEDNAAWNTWDAGSTNKWYVGSGLAKDGDNALYISNDGGVTAKYTVSSDSPDNGAVWASRTLNLPKGEYTISFDWTCFGYQLNASNAPADFLRVGLLPGDAVFTSSVGSAQGKVTNTDGSITTMAASDKGTPIDWISLEGVSDAGTPNYYLIGVGSTTTGEIDWRTNTTMVVVPEDGYYNLVFYWRNSSTLVNNDTHQPEPSAVIDNVKIEKAACPLVLDLRYADLADTSLTLAWTPLDDAQDSWNVKVLDVAWGVDSVGNAPDSVVVFTTTANDTTCAVTGLQPDTEYYAYVQGACGSKWVQLDVRTTCTPRETGYVWTFEEEGGYVTSTSKNYLAPDCWIVGNAKSTGYSYIPYKKIGTNSVATNNFIYSMGEGRGYSLYFNSTATNEPAYAVMPSFVGDPDTLQLRFYARSCHTQVAYNEANGGYKVQSVQTGSDYAHSITVGTLTDPYDLSTFQELKTFVMSTRSTSEYANAENNWLFDECTVPLEGAKGRYIVFLSEFGMKNTVYVDNVTVEKLSFCNPPSNLSVGTTTAHTAELLWSSADEESNSWTVQVATDAAFDNVVFADTVSAKSCLVPGLDAAAVYYASVCTYCSEEDQSSVVTTSFRTASVPLYHEDFSVYTHNTPGWQRYTCLFDADSLATADMGGDMSNITGAGGGWTPIGEQKYVTLEDADTKHWIVTPQIELPTTDELEENEHLWLTVDVGMRDEDGTIATAPNDDDRFLIVISDDGGLSWKQVDILAEWNNAGTGDYVLNNLKTTFTNYRFDLSAYEGKVIKVGFYAESSVANASPNLYIDNVRINRYVEVNPEASQCEGYDYEGEGFYITYDNLEPGENEFQRMAFSNTSAIADSVVNLTVAVTAMPTDTIEATTCEGEPYENYGFEVAAGESGEFKRKLKSEETGCDSVAVLKLNIIGTLRVQLMDTICQGQTYTFGGQELNRTGIYVDTVASQVTRCDSITTLALTVRDALRTTLTDVACFGEPYTFGELTLTASGTYADTLQTAAGCDSIVTLNLTVRDEIPPTHIYGYVCPDETYTDEHFEGVPARVEPYELTVTTDWGACDSLLVLHLTELDDDTVYTEYRIDEDELPFTYHGKTYNVGKTGAHVQTLEVTSQSGNCSAVLVATLIIGDNVGMGMTQGGSLTIVPTLINRGQSVRLSGSGTAELEVAVFDMTGRLVFHDESMAMPAELQAFDASGIYTVKAINGNGQVMYGRVIVK